MSSTNSDWIEIASETDVELGKAKPFEVRGEHIALFHTEEGWFAIAEMCSHRGAPLSEGAVQGATVRCPWHAARFDLTTGKAMNAPAETDQKKYDLKVADGKIYLCLS